MFDYAEQLLPDTYPTLNCIQKTFGSNIYTDYSDFIDRKTHTCSFDSSLFRRYLEYLRSLPTEEYRKLPEVGNADFDKIDELYRNQVFTLRPISTSGIDVVYHWDAYLQTENPYFIGTPNNTEYSELSAFFRHYMNERGREPVQNFMQTLAL